MSPLGGRHFLVATSALTIDAKMSAYKEFYDESYIYVKGKHTCTKYAKRFFSYDKSVEGYFT